MRIAIVYPSLRAVGGAENVVIWLAESLVEHGHYVSLFTWEFSEEVWGKMREKPYNVCLLDFKKHRSTLRTNRDGGMALQRALKLSLYEFDVINPHNYPASLWVYYAKQQMKEFPRVLLYLHNLQPNFYEKILSVHYRQLSGLRNMWNRFRPKKIFRSLRQSLFGYRRLDKAAIASCDMVLANSEYAVDMAKKIYGVDVKSCPLGIPVERFKGYIDDASRYSVNKNDQERSILTVSRIEIQKNLDTILKAVKILKERNGLPKGFQHKIAGGGPHLKYYMKKCRIMGLSDVVRFLGSIPHKEIWKLYAECEFLVHVPLDEPFGLVPVEAALLKKPSIVSNHGGPSEIVIDGVTGLQVDALNEEDIAERMACLLERPDHARALGESAFQLVSERYVWNIFVERFEQNLRVVAGSTNLNRDREYYSVNFF